MEMGATAASRAMGVSRGKARYWESKGQEPDFHPVGCTLAESHGGSRYSTLEPADQIALEWACFSFGKQNQVSLTQQLCYIFVLWVGRGWSQALEQDPSRLKFLDESHFENWDCSRWQWCRGQGVREWLGPLTVAYGHGKFYDSDRKCQINCVVARSSHRQSLLQHICFINIIVNISARSRF
eukprot:g79555.t1